MKKYILLATVLCMTISVYGQEKNSKANQRHLKKLYSKYDKNLKKQHKLLRSAGVPPNPYNEEDYKRTMDPVTGGNNFDKLAKLNEEINQGKYAPTRTMSLISGQESSTQKIVNEPWIERGPYNVGGRTRAIMYDPNDPLGKRVFAGGVSGGLWVNQDPTISTNEWTPLSTFWANTSISCIAYDPNNTQILYVGTGESSTSDAIGSGIWRSINGGSTWTQIFTISPVYSGTIRSGNFYINDIKVRNNAGVSEVYAGVSGNYNDGAWQGLNQAGLYKSTDQGATFIKNTSLLALNTTTNVTSSTGYSIQQIEIGADNSVWVSTRSSRYSNIDSGGRILKSADGDTFSEVYNVGNSGSRVNFSLSRTNANKVYAFMQGEDNSSEPIRIAKSTDGGLTWASTNDMLSNITLPTAADTSIPANDFTRGQSFYDLVIATDPLDDETVYIGGIDLYKSSDGGASWTQISKWSNNNNMANLQVSQVHADQHEIVFNPFNNYSTNQMMFGNDGGIYFVPNKNTIATVGGFAVRNTRYNVTQFYTAMLNPTKTPADEELLAGAQDNGSWWLYGVPQANNFLTSQAATSGDGMYTEYDDLDNYEIASYVYNNHYLLTNNIYYLISSANRNAYGHFVNEIALDRVNNVFYSYRSGLTLFRTSGLSATATTFTNNTVSAGTAQTNEQISWMKVSPYTTASTTLFVGTNLGRIFKITNANSTSYTSTAITSPATGTISDIEFGANENEIIVTLSNYNVVSVFYSTDGGTSWQNKEGNLPDMPVRTVLRNPDDANEVILGTEMGVWGTTNFLSSSPTWASITGNIGNIRITNLDYRPSTKTVLVSTYGRGAWTTQNTILPLATDEIKSKKDKVRIYPNPSKGIAHLRFDSAKYDTVDISIFDASGRLIYSKKNVKSDEEFGQRLTPGNYVLKAESKGEIVYSGNYLVLGKVSENGDDD
ncbi:Por secretion system C-terminal sorting domain-containing protein [Chryseobacterium taichungense]|uniref:Por secretion system C-terminal sorting domain-containing protein n=1 Tax=Chryseobacterium taichungense TaxID=295069 RepID=A0A1H7WA19_9FLAO|nr:T9SS type A sorting domain-containing protein [Chryseobacterium taichungense]SEM17767.1 Por secretion system C-terminal sorting domain-containing protein [Chryseobacterium taichungense]